MLQLCVNLHDGCLQVLAGGGPRLILDLPGACFLPEHEPYVSAIFRHILEDPVTLQAAMEAEIRNTLTARGSQANAAEGKLAYTKQKTAIARLRLPAEFCFESQVSFLALAVNNLV